MNTATRFAMSALCLCSALFFGCVDTQRIERDPISAMLDRSQGADYQLRAARMAAAQYSDDPRYYTALHDLLWNRGYAAEVRRFAIDELVRIDEADFRQKVARRINLLYNWDTLDYVFELAIQRNWPDFTPVLVRNWARPARGMSEADRPERKFIEKLNPGRDVEEVVFEVFTDTSEKVSESQRIAAWELLGRIGDPEKLIGYLNAAPASDALVADLKAAAAELHALPSNREGVLWLQYLRKPEQKAFWDAAAAVVARLSPEQRRGLQLRHMAVLVRLSASELALDRAALLADVADALAKAEHHYKGPTYDAPMRNWPQRLYDARDKLVWADLATIRLLLRAMQDREMVASLFAQADADLEDKHTEYGGVIDETSGAFKAVGYKPLSRRHDWAFIPSQKMVDHLYTAVAHYHFHAQHYGNGDHAGPGNGDLHKMSDNLRPNAVVFTFIDRDRLNVDYYQPGGTVVDLGTIRR